MSKYVNNLLFLFAGCYFQSYIKQKHKNKIFLSITFFKQQKYKHSIIYFNKNFNNFNVSLCIVRRLLLSWLMLSFGYGYYFHSFSNWGAHTPGGSTEVTGGRISNFIDKF